jgi:hypothetical protein
MPLPEPTAEELAYGRFWARVHGVRHDPQQFAAGYALGRKQAQAEAFAAGRRKAAAAIRAHITAGARLPEWARAGATPTASAIREWAARIAEGAAGETPEQSAATVDTVTTDLDTCIAETAGVDPEFRAALAAALAARDAEEARLAAMTQGNADA